MIVVTGATGHLGRLVVEALVQKVPADQVVAAVRNPEKAAGLAALGVQVRTADYDQPSTLTEAFAGADKVLLVSGSEVGRRVAQHTAAVQAAKAAGVTHLIYTSILRADTSTIGLASEHKATEDVVRDSGIPFTFLRNSWYTENYEQAVAQAVATGAVLGSAGEGKAGGVPREDYAGAAVEVLIGTGHENKVYELAADEAWSYTDLAEAIARISGKPVSYQDVPAEQHRSILVGAGLPEFVADMLVDADRAIAAGELASDSGDLRALLGRPTTPLDTAVTALLKNLG
ncbi:SDR family oxidoreductase [Lentzea flava]|uniref:NAD(P)-dependent oxidoreductase n=1 Tax=Lentzea flava TaxID=103732 RepID=A0ABQ2V3J8_9PSEU|nr:SDR family oxidoreductase [Lentzea flava]MCP2203267.1 NAD(P)H dehydrogenase (quinone) [Lentzea flava]GGU67392.1 NAD(P)-dependent oxidoreductase [Lentzea flava]